MTATLILVILGLLAGALYGVLRSHEEAKAEERARYRRIVSASSENRERINWPPRPRGEHSTPWKDRRPA